MDMNFPEYWIFILVVIIASVIIAKVLRILMTRFFNAAAEKLSVDPTKYNFLKNAVSLIVFLIALTLIFYHIPELRKYGVTLFASAGIFAAIIGFAAQGAFSNIISGIFLVIFKPFKVGDIVSVGESYSGTVEDITLRHTVINNYENRRIVIPNAIISNQTILNSSLNDTRVCMHIEMAISYESNLDLAMEILQEECTNHPEIVDNRSPEDKKAKVPKVIVRVLRIDDSAIIIRAWAWANEPRTGFILRCDVFKSCKERYDASGIEIPYPHRTLTFKELEALKKALSGKNSIS